MGRQGRQPPQSGGRSEARTRTVGTDAARVDPLSRGFAVAVIAGLCLVAAASFALSFNGLSAFGRDAIGLDPWLAVLLPLTIDASILVFSGSVILNTARGESTVVGWTLLVLSTAISSAINAAEVIATAPAEPAAGLPAWAAPTVAALVPAFLLASTEVVVRTIVRPAAGPIPTANPNRAFEPPPADKSDHPSPAPVVRSVESAPESNPDAEPQTDRPSTPTPVPARALKRTAPKPKSSGSASAVPPDREDEVAALIDAALDAGLSRQKTADKVSEQTGLAISKSRVSRRAASRAANEPSAA